ncbi:hypothetical protein ACKWTF_000472 [Chironomus riparius]
MAQDLNIEVEIEEYDWEYFHSHPFVLFLHVILSIFIVLIGIIGNAVIVAVKITKVRQLKAVDILIVNLAISSILYCSLILLQLSDDAYGSLYLTLCYVKFIVIHHSAISFILTISALIIISKFFCDLDKSCGYYIVAIIWIIAVFVAYPYVSLEMYDYPTSTGTEIYFCAPKVEEYEAFCALEVNLLIIEYLVPTLVLAGSSAYLSKSLKTENFVINKNVYHYSVFVGLLHIISIIPTIAFILLFYGTIDISFISSILLCYLYYFVVPSNVFVICYFDREFYKEVLESFEILIGRKFDNRDLESLIKDTASDEAF